MRSNRAFTLAELLIGVTVSAIIMTGVAVFVGSGIENSYRIRKGLEENRSSGNFDSVLGDVASFWGNLLFSWSFSAPYGSGFVLRNADRNVPISIITAKTVTGVCDAYSWTTDVSGTWTVLEIIETFRIDGVRDAPWFTIDHAGHAVRNSGGAVVLWTGNPWKTGGKGEPATSTELRFPTAIVSAGGWKYLVADSGNDRVLVYDGSVTNELVWPDSWTRQPYDIAIGGGSVGILENGRISTINGSPNVTGGSFSGTFRAETPFSFDSVRVTLGGWRIPPSAFSSYAMDFSPSSGTAAVVGNTATLSFSGASYSYAAWQTGNLSISGIPVTAAANGWHLANVEYYSGGTLKYRRDFPYFASSDGDPLTPDDNSYAVTRAPNGILPVNPAFSWTGLTFGNYSNYAQSPITAAVSKKTTSPRLVDSIRLETTGGMAMLSYFEYVRFDCLHGNHVKRERIVKIPLK